jgi:predicted DNA-binding protein
MTPHERSFTMPTGIHKNPHYALRIPTETMNKLKFIAAYNGRSANKEIEQLILRHIAEFEKNQGLISASDLQKL